MTLLLMQPPYPIEILDVSHYQNYNAINQDVGIDFKAAKATRSSLRGVYIKCGEGTWTGYPENVYKLQAQGFLDAGFDTAPYHFHHTEIDPILQAKYFKKRAALVPYKWKRVVVDMEDTDRTDNQPPKQAINPGMPEYNSWVQKARTLLGKVKLYLNAVSQEFGASPIAYTGDWWIGWQIQLCALDGVNIDFLNDYFWAIASYTSPYMYTPYGIKKEKVCIWQHTSTPPAAMQVNGFPWRERLDMNYWLLSEAEYLDLVGASTPPVPPDISDAEKLNRLWLAHPELWGG